MKIDKYKNHLANSIMLTLVFSLLFTSCLDNALVQPIEFRTHNSEDILYYLESIGDFPNSLDAPGLVGAGNVFYHINEYLIIDVRSEEQFMAGHIMSAVNISHDNLLDYIENITVNSYNKIVIVSTTGQAACYYTALLRFCHYENVFALKYGMASWNMYFAAPWLNATKSSIMLNSFNSVTQRKNPYTLLPTIDIDSYESITETIKSRVRILLEDEFIDFGVRDISCSASITLDVLYENYISSSEGFANYYPVCLGTNDLYYASMSSLESNGHPPTAVLIKALSPFFEMRSNKYLQTMPIDKTLALYCFNGNLSACFTAYLRLLGYDAKSILFGYNTFNYPRMLTFPVFEEYTFNNAQIHNYPYVTGNSLQEK